MDRDSGNGHQQMEKQDGQIAHRRILPRSEHGPRMLADLEFPELHIRRRVCPPGHTGVQGALVFAQRPHWIDVAGAIGRQIAGDERRHTQQHYDADIGTGIGRRDAEQ
jgi:hypothetical protein